MPVRSLGRLAPRAATAGLLLGRDTERQPVLLPVPRPEPARLVLFGGLWLSRIVVFRALALGVRVYVRTVDPRRWDGFGASAAGAADRVVVLTGPPHQPIRGHAAEPVLHVADLDGRPGPDLGPDDGWQSTLTIAAQLTQSSAEALAAADAALLQRMWPQQAEYAANLLGADPTLAAVVAGLPDDAAVLLSRGSHRQLWLAPTGFEQRLFGSPQRS